MFAKFAMMLGGSTAAAGGPAAIAFAAAASSSANAAAYTFSAHSIGTASSDRHVVVCVAFGDTGANSVDFVTVGGQSCTQIAAIQNGSFEAFAGIFITDAPVTSGTTADVIVDLANFANNCGIGTFALTGLSSITATDTATTTTDGSAQSLDINADGVAVGVTSFDGTSVSWTNMTERYDANTEGTAGHSGASTTSATTQTLSVTSTVSGSNLTAVAYASFR